MAKEFNRVFDYVCYWAEKLPNHTALIFNDKTISYQNLRDCSISAATQLLKLGVKSGDIIMYSLNSAPEFFFLYIGASMIGASVSGVNVRSTYFEIVKTIHIIKPKIVICDNANLIKSLAKNSDFSGDILSITNFDFSKIDSSYLKKLDKIIASITGDETVFIIFTSGTTGNSKGSCLSHKNIIASANSQSKEFGAPIGANEDDIYQHQVPINHVSGAVEWGFVPFLTGSTIVVVQQFDPSVILQNTQKYHITFLAGVPTMWEMMFNVLEFKKYDLSSVRWCMSGAAQINESLVKRILEICENYSNPLGMTETSGFCSGFDGDYNMADSVNTVGKIFSILEYKIIDENFNEVNQGDVGQLAYRGESVIKKYFLSDIPKTKDGFFLSGDMAFEDAKRKIHFCGRKDDMFTVGGYNVFPQEIEKVIMSFGGIKQALVVPTYHSIMGNVCKAYITVDGSKNFNIQKLKSFLEEHLIYYKIPRDIKVLDKFPVNPLGKILKSELLLDTSK